MKLAFAIIFVLCVGIIDARRKNGNNRQRNGGSSLAEDEPKNGRGGKAPNHKGFKGKFPFPLFEKCKDFNVEYSVKKKELKRSNKIWVNNCRTGEEAEQELCKTQGISSIRCEMNMEPSEECRKEIDEFLNKITCGGSGEFEPEGEGDFENEDGEFEEEGAD